MNSKQKPPAIALTPVQSSQIAAIGHSPETNTLAIQFRRGKDGLGAVYHYANVPADMHTEMLQAESIGKFFGERIKPEVKKHPFTRIAEPPADDDNEEALAA